MKHFLCALSFFASYSSGFSQLTVTTSPDTNQIRNQLQGSGVQIYGFEIYADTISYGIFQGNSELPISSGFAITTGNVNDMSGHCDSVFADTVLLHDNFVGWSETRDVHPTAVYDYNRISFSVVTVGDTLTVACCLASEDYIRLTNDVAAIMISGPNPLGGQYDTVRLGWIHNGSPICIWNACPAAFNTYYIDYWVIPAQYESYYGGTVYLERKIAVVPGQPYYVSFSVADSDDGNYDSALLVEGLWSDSTVDVPEKPEYSLNLYPNPANTELVLQFSDLHQRTILLYDSFGREILQTETSASLCTINVESFAEGIYFYCIVEDGEVKSNGKLAVLH